jgi:patatin-like phospholipase/acyl hydrolase
MTTAPSVGVESETTAGPSPPQTSHDPTLDNTGYCLLSLDGGGVRGLSTLYILQSIMRLLNYTREEAGLGPKKPCEIFDLIGGTSTGG